MTIIGVVGAVLGIAGILGGALAVFAAGRSRTIIDLQKTTIDEMVRRDTIREAELVELRAETAANRERIALLTEMVTGAAKVDQLTTAVSSHHEEMMTALTALLTESRAILAAVTR